MDGGSINYPSREGIPPPLFSISLLLLAGTRSGVAPGAETGVGAGVGPGVEDEARRASFCVGSSGVNRGCLVACFRLVEAGRGMTIQSSSSSSSASSGQFWMSSESTDLPLAALGEPASPVWILTLGALSGLDSSSSSLSHMRVKARSTSSSTC